MRHALERASISIERIYTPPGPFDVPPRGTVRPISRISLPLAGDHPLYQGNLEADLQLVSRNRLAEKITGGLAWPGKMPCPAWGISASRCKVGSVLAQVEGTICHACYAGKGTFRFENTRRKLEIAYQGLNHPLWVPSMIFLIRWHAADRFRWFHSGDLQHVNHFRAIIRVCLETPDVLHWLPTRESETVLACRQEVPPNLVVRASGTRIDGPPPAWWPLTSTVVTSETASTCPASVAGGNCDSHGCRACWEPSVPNVAYRLH